MRITIVCATLALALGMAATPVFAQCEDKSQQNAADEAVAKGDLGAASKCATKDDVDRSEKKLENAAEKAREKQDARSDGLKRESEQQRSDSTSDQTRLK
jgi:sensor histidine kinase regulating citrate/malate metabolism